MKTKSGLFSRSRGFTLAELLTTMAIMAILIALIMPALGLIQKTAQKVRQKSQFHGIDIVLESFHTDFGDYPPSTCPTEREPGNWLDDYCGAQKLAEAVVGLDGFGVHPRAEFWADGLADWNGNRVYDPDESVYHVTFDTPYETAVDNRKVRKGPYLELEAANAVKLSDLYQGAVGTLDVDTYILADMFGKVTHRRTHKRTGMPILYYKADVGGTDHRPPNIAPIPRNNVYEIRDNQEIYSASPPFGNTPHPLATMSNQTIFYDRTANPNFPGPPRRPYRSESFILHSAGADGLYGTADDVYNFDSEQ